MTAEVIDIMQAAIKRDEKKFGFVPLSETDHRKEMAEQELAAWAARYRNLGASFFAQQGQSLLMMSDMMKHDR